MPSRVTDPETPALVSVTRAVAVLATVTTRVPVEPTSSRRAPGAISGNDASRSISEQRRGCASMSLTTSLAVAGFVGFSTTTALAGALAPHSRKVRPAL